MEQGPYGALPWDQLLRREVGPDQTEPLRVAHARGEGILEIPVDQPEPIDPSRDWGIDGMNELSRNAIRTRLFTSGMRPPSSTRAHQVPDIESMGRLS